MEKILCIEDTPEIVKIIQATLREYQVTVASTIKEAQEQLINNHFKVILVDIELPDGRGHEIMPLIQNHLQNTVVIFLTSHNEYHEKLTAFSLGAADFVQKPFDPRELKLRIQTHLKRLHTQNENHHVLKIGRLTCNFDEHKVYPDDEKDKPMDLTNIEFRIFKLLSKNPNKIYSREEILQKVWGQTVSITPRTVDVHISNLRKKLDECDVSIHHKHGSGYFISPHA